MPDVPNSPGPGVDAVGRPVVDPTKNVQDLIELQNKRQDDLREKDNRHIREITEVREEHNRELHVAEREYDKEFRRAERQHDKELREAESQRIDAIRAVDVGAVAVANTAAENRASTLAGQVNAAKDAQGVALKAETDPIRKDIGDLRQSQWTIAGGRDQVVETRAAGASWGLWVGIGVAALGIMGTVFMGSIAIAVTLYLALR